MILITTGFCDYTIASIVQQKVPKVISYYDQNIDNLVEKCTGIILTGGCDINPKFYNATPLFRDAYSDERDSFEFSLLELAIKYAKPVLGICRGHQLINVYLGGNLFQDLNYCGFSNHTNTIDFPHIVLLNANNILPTTVKSIVTNTIHHQAIKDVGDGLISFGIHKYDGTIEAIYHPKLNWLGVQWHPELDRNGTQGSIVWSWVLNNM